MISSPYFFASINDEYARRGEHVEITRANGERAILARRPDFVDSCDLHPPLPDESTCAAQEAGHPDLRPQQFEVVDDRITSFEWCLFVAAGLLAIVASFLSPYWITP